MYVTRLLPDTISNVTDNLPALEEREAILIGEAVNVPVVIMVDNIVRKPSSENVLVLTKWRKYWHNLAFPDFVKRIQKLNQKQ